MTGDRQRHPRLTDDAVAGLPLHRGRSELLEEIMRTPVVDDTPVRQQPSRHPSRWLAPLAAAAVVAGLATVPAWWGSDDPEPASPIAPAAQPEPTEPGDHVILDAPGWTVTYTSQTEYGGEVSYSRRGAEFEISSSPAASYADYVEDREHIVDPPAPGEPVEVLGKPGQLWAYSADDHTVIREVERGQWREFRGSGIGKAEFLNLLGELELVDLDTFEASLPEEFVTTAERDDVVEEMLDGIGQALAPSGLMPLSTVSATYDTDETDRYQLGAHVAGVVACAWLDSYVEGETSGDADQRAAAVAAMQTSREWPILVEMDAEGDYPEVVWDYADQIAAGRTPEGFEGGLGCE